MPRHIWGVHFQVPLGTLYLKNHRIHFPPGHIGQDHRIMNRVFLLELPQRCSCIKIKMPLITYIEGIDAMFNNQFFYSSI